MTASSTGTAPGGLTSTKAITKYDKKDTRPVVPAVAQAMLIKYGALIAGGSGAVRFLRV
jgi:hypothetical protein